MLRCGLSWTKTCGANPLTIPLTPSCASRVANITAQAEATKKCNSLCKKVKPLCSFYSDQNSCKDCFSEEKKLKNRAGAQGVAEWASTLKKDDPKAYEKLFRTFSAHVKSGKDGK
eukprot:9477200-Pyramimonas_sp.AAC.1